MSPLIFITRELAVDAQAYVGDQAQVQVFEHDRPIRQNELIEAAAQADALITMVDDPCDQGLIDALPQLKVIANAAVGYNNIDVAACRTAGIVATHTPGVLTEATADLTWALILACTRRLGEGEALVRSGGFEGWAPNLLLGLGLQGKTLGIYGMGRIGQAVARRGIAFGMKTLYHNRRPLDAAAEDALKARYVTQDDLLSSSDILSIHAPLTPETTGAFGASELAQMKPGAVLINTARGALVDEDALVRALGCGQLWGAGLDVYEGEPEVHPGLLHCDRVVLLPHLGSATQETRGAMARMALDNALAVLAGAPAPNPVPQA